MTSIPQWPTCLRQHASSFSGSMWASEFRCYSPSSGYAPALFSWCLRATARRRVVFMVQPYFATASRIPKLGTALFTGAMPPPNRLSFTRSPDAGSAVHLISAPFQWYMTEFSAMALGLVRRPVREGSRLQKQRQRAGSRLQKQPTGLGWWPAVAEPGACVR